MNMEADKSKILLYNANGEPLRYSNKQSKDNHLDDVKKKLKSQIPEDKIVLPSALKMVEKLNKNVYGHFYAKKKLALALKGAEQRINFPKIGMEKSNMLFYGDTGCGKSWLIENLAKITNLPLIKVNMTGISSTGYVGGSFDDVFEKLIDRNDASFDMDEYLMLLEDGEMDDIPLKQNAPYAIVHIDEIDKIANRSFGSNGFNEDLQNELIGYVENSEILNGLLNTNNMTFIGTGRFYGLEEIVLSRLNKKSSIGFSSNVKQNVSNYSQSELFSYVQPIDLIKYGFRPELVGRFPISFGINSLSVEDLEGILDIKTSYLSKKRKMFKEAYDINLRFTKAAKKQIAQFAKQTSTNARGLKSAIENVLEDFEFHAADYRGKTVVFDKDIESLLYKK
ncbi:MAG: AAA family ATPase [archaeon]